VVAGKLSPGRLSPATLSLPTRIIGRAFDRRPCRGPILRHKRGTYREGIHYLAAGHYATERLGVRALGDHLRERFGLDVEFIDVPNPV